MSDQNKGKRKNRFKYYGGSKKNKLDDAKEHNELYENLTGFLVTCNNNEYKCLQETYNLLEEIAERLYGTADRDPDDDDQQEEGDIEALIKQEIDHLKTAKKRRFIQVKTKCKNVLFIKSNDEKVKVDDVISELFRSIKDAKCQTVCNISRILPVSGTFKADNDKLEARFEQLFDQMATKKAVSYAIQAKARNNNDFPSDTALMKRITVVVRDKRSNWVVDLTKPDLLVIVNIVQRSLCLSLVSNYNEFAKYNPIGFHNKMMEQHQQQKLEVKAQQENGAEEENKE